MIADAARSQAIAADVAEASAWWKRVSDSAQHPAIVDTLFAQHIAWPVRDSSGVIGTAIRPLPRQ